MASAAWAQEPLRVDDADGCSRAEDRWVGYVSLIQHEMEAQHFSLRALELKSRVNRARLGRILHRDAAKRHPMTLAEFQALLRALDIDPFEAMVAVELNDHPAIAQDERFAKLAVMLSSLFRGLPQRLIVALHDLDGMDGSEIRQEWGTYFQSAVVNRMVHEIGQILERRARMSANSDPFSF